jgi:WD40 repeat protein
MANISCLAPVPDGRHLLVGEIDLTSKGAGFTLHGVLRLFDLDDRSCVRVFDAEDYPPVAAVVAGDGRIAVTTCWARDLAVWDLESDAVVQVIEGQRGGQPDLAETRSLALRGDGRVAMNGGDDGRMRLWDVAAGCLIREFEAHPGDARACAWSGDARVAVTGGDDGNLRVWGLEWEYDFPPAADDVAAAMPYVRILSTLRRRLPGTGDPDADAAWIHDRLGDAGVGWMRRRAVRRLVGVA